MASSTSHTTPLSALGGDWDFSALDWGYHRLPLEIKQMILRHVISAELRVNVHHFSPRPKQYKGVTKHCAVEVVNKSEWRTMLRLQRIKEINDEIIQPAIAKKEIVVVLDLMTHGNRGSDWDARGSPYVCPYVRDRTADFCPSYGQAPLGPDLDKCVLDWEALLDKFPFKRLMTTVPQLLEPEGYVYFIENPSEVHYLRLTFDEITAKPAHGQLNPLEQKETMWNTGSYHGPLQPDKQHLRSKVEEEIKRGLGPKLSWGLSESVLGELQHCVVWLSEKVTKPIGTAVASWGEVIIKTIALVGPFDQAFREAKESRDMFKMEDIVWDKRPA